MHLILGTAGHIDHGKTALIKALTGIDCDRLEEEKARGITIELGFAYMDLPGAGRVGVVDVPGHERFVRNMVSGAAGIDLVLLVVAADEGVMPQTREHLDICRLLDVRHGLVALTKVDMVEEDLLELATEEVRAELAGTFLEDAPLIPVSSHTGQGLDDLRAALARVVAQVPGRDKGGLFRLPVDRAFTMKGFGSVITGTCVGGSLAKGEAITVYPHGHAAKVRGLQNHGLEADEVQAGQRSAVNLSGIDLDKLHRGQVLARPGSLFPELSWEVELTCLPSSPRSLKHRREVHFHHGSAETLARIHFLDREALEPGDTAVCQVRFREPWAGVFGDRVVVRSYSPLRTIAGGRVVSPLARRVKRFSDQVDAVRELAGAESIQAGLIQLARAGSEGLGLERLAVCMNLGPAQARKALEQEMSKGTVLLTAKDPMHLHHVDAVHGLEDGLEGFLAAYHKKNPMHAGAPRGEALSAWAKGKGTKRDPGLHEELASYVLNRLTRQGRAVAEGDTVRLAGHEVSLASDQDALRASLLDTYTKAGATPPNLKDVLADLDITAKQAEGVLRLLRETGELVRVSDELLFHGPALASIRAKLEAWFDDNEDLSAPDFKALTGLTRKYLIPLLEHFDRERVTVRVGDVRRLRRSLKK